MAELDAIHVTLLRHGESESNRSGRWQGQGDSPLSQLGRQQAACVGARLSRRRFDRVVSSDLQRAADTARATGFELELDAAFRELDVGSWEGLTRQEVQDAFPEEMERLAQGEDLPLGGGETYAAFVERVEVALQRVTASMSGGERVLIVCHGGVIGALVSVALGIRKRGYWPISRVSNTALTELSVSAESLQLQVFNDDLHLEGLAPSETDLVRSGHEIVVHEQGALLEGLSDYLQGAPAYQLFEEPSPSISARSFVSEERGAAALEAWLRYAEANYAGQVARCLAAAEDVTDWLGAFLELSVGASAHVAAPRTGSWARLRGGERPVVQRYNAIRD